MDTPATAAGDQPVRAGGREADDRAVARASLWGVVVSVALLALAVVIAAASGSLTLFAAAVDCAVDVVTALVLWIGLKVAERASPRFPYGLYKVENVLQVVIALLLFVAAYEVAARAVTGSGREVDIEPWVIAGAAASIVITWVYGWYVLRVGRRVGSPRCRPTAGTARRTCSPRRWSWSPSSPRPSVSTSTVSRPSSSSPSP